MQSVKVSGLLVESLDLPSSHLHRPVKIDCYLPKNVADPSTISLLLINDGQDMEVLGLEDILTRLYAEGAIRPLLCVGIHAGIDRKKEYGVAGQPDYMGRGDRAGLFARFVLEELIPHIQSSYALERFAEIGYAGFSLGGLMALDMVWTHPEVFTKAGIFSASLWWRMIDQEEPDYDDEKHRIMHQQVKTGGYRPGLKFFFQCGALDETKDRNHNGIIDSIDDTLDLIRELEALGYRSGYDIHYLELPDGRHDVPSWGRAMPEFLKWGWGRPA